MNSLACALLPAVRARERAALTTVLIVVGIACAAVAVYYAFTRNNFLSHATGYHRDRAIILAVIAVVVWVAAGVVARLRPRSV